MLRKVTIGVATLVTTSIIPVIPQDLSLEYAYSAPCISKLERILNRASTTYQKPEYQSSCTVGEATIAVFSDGRGNRVFVEIPNDTYRKMGERGGIAFNPQKTQFNSLFKSLTEPLLTGAAISETASSSANCSSCTSLTYSLDSGTASDRYMVVETRTQNANTVSGVKYNGTSMTEIGSDQASGGVNYSSAWWLSDPSTGTNNIVVSVTSAKNISSVALALSGAKAQAPEAITEGSWTSGASFSASVTTLTDNAWVLLLGRENYATAVPGTNTHLIIEEVGSLLYGSDSNPVSPAGSVTVNATMNASVTFGYHLVSIEKAAATAAALATTPPDIIFFQ